MQYTTKEFHKQVYCHSKEGPNDYQTLQERCCMLACFPKETLPILQASQKSHSMKQQASIVGECADCIINFVVKFVSFLWFMTTTKFFYRENFSGSSACTVLLDQKHLVEDRIIIRLSLLAVYFHLKLSLHTSHSTSCSTSPT